MVGREKPGDEQVTLQSLYLCIWCLLFLWCEGQEVHQSLSPPHTFLLFALHLPLTPPPPLIVFVLTLLFDLWPIVCLSASNQPHTGVSH